MNQNTQSLFRTTHWIKTYAPSPLTLLSAILIVLSFPPFGYYPLLWIALLPWLIALDQAKSVKMAAKEGFWLGYGMSLGGFHWVAYVLTEFGGIPYSLGLVGLFLFATVCEPQFIVAAVIFKKMKKAPESSTSSLLQAMIPSLFFALAYTGIDWLLPKLFIDTLGHAFYAAPYFRQIADIGGASLITFLIIWFNFALWQILKASPKRNLSASLSFILCSVTLGLGFIYGFFRYQQITLLQSQPTSGIQTAAIQANIGDFEKLAAERGIQGAGAHVIEEFTRLSREAMKHEPRPEVLLWPETAYPTSYRNSRTALESYLEHQLESLLREIQVPILFGGYDTDHVHDYNSFFFLSPNGDLQVYHKNILLLFGEYIPGADLFPFLRDAFPQVGNFGRGNGPEVLKVSSTYPGSNPHLKTLLVQPAICYEILFPNFIREAAQKGSQAIFNITNDSWFGNWGEPQLHLALSTFRAIETRLPILRSTNTGISALILPNGEIQNQTDIGKQAILHTFIPTTQPIPTLFKKWGDWLGPFTFILSLAFILTALLKRKFLSESAAQNLSD